MYNICKYMCIYIRVFFFFFYPTYLEQISSPPLPAQAVKNAQLCLPEPRQILRPAESNLFWFYLFDYCSVKTNVDEAHETYVI